MMGRRDRDQGQLLYEFSLDEMIPTDHLLRRINVFATAVLADLHHQLKAFYSDIGRPSVDPELMIRMLLVGYCYGIRHEMAQRILRAASDGITDPITLTAMAIEDGMQPAD
jgi:transposase